MNQQTAEGILEFVGGDLVSKRMAYLALGIFVIVVWLFYPFQSAEYGGGRLEGPLVISGLLFLAGHLVIQNVYTHLLFNSAPLLSVSVKVISKEFQTINRGISKHYIAFEFPDRTRKSFQVDIKNYNIILEGDTGLLHYKEQEDRLWFVDFQRQA